MGVTSIGGHTRPDCNARYDVRIKLVETWLFVCLTWRGNVGRLFMMVLHVVLTPWNPGRWLVESELIQHVFEILDSDWLCDEVTSITTYMYILVCISFIICNKVGGLFTLQSTLWVSSLKMFTIINYYYNNYNNNNHNYNVLTITIIITNLRFLRSDWPSTALMTVLLEQYASCLNNWIVRAITRALKWLFFFTASKKNLGISFVLI